jgi:hypothetical protein
MEDYFELLEHKKSMNLGRFAIPDIRHAHSFNILLILFNHRKLHLSTTDIWKHNLYIIADNFDSLPQHNFVQNEISLTLTSISS